MEMEMKSMYQTLVISTPNEASNSSLLTINNKKNLLPVVRNWFWPQQIQEQGAMLHFYTIHMLLHL
jgi:hypothetical protein